MWLKGEVEVEVEVEVEELVAKVEAADIAR